MNVVLSRARSKADYLGLCREGMSFVSGGVKISMIFTNLADVKRSVVAVSALSMLCIALNLHAEEQYYDVTVKQYDQSLSQTLRVYNASHDQVIFEYKKAGDEPVSKEMFEKVQSTYMAQGVGLDTYISERPVYNLKDLYTLLSNQISSGYCYDSKHSAVSLPEDAVFYGDALLLSKPERVISVTHQCQGQVHAFNISFSDGTASALMLNNQGELQKIESRYKDKQQSMVLKPVQLVTAEAGY